MKLLPLFLALGCSAPPAPDDTEGTSAPCTVGLALGECAPDFALPDRNGDLIALDGQRGKVALVDLSALW